jgi:SPP1 gp7 family putative phage head morphogenesis protein
MAGDSLNYIGLQAPFTTIPIGAVRNQAERFRERLVNYSNQQASQISAVVEQGLIQGWGTRKIEGQLKTLGVSFKSNAETIARTETMSAYNGAAKSRYEQAGVAYVQWIATPAEGTCSLCYARNTKAWKTTEAPSIPAHPRCRCTYLPTASLSDIDTAFYEDYSKQGLDDLERQGLQPDNGPTYWEKKAGITPAKPSWVPGQAVPVAPVVAKPAPTAGLQQLTKISGEDPGAQAKIKEQFQSWRSSINQAYAQNVSSDVIFDVALITESLEKQKSKDIRAVIDQDGTMQAATSVRARKDHLYVELLATSPANVLQKTSITLTPPVKAVKGAGTQMMREIVLESLEKGFGGEVRLEALTNAVSFYEKIGFVITKGGSLPKMRLTPEKAIEFLQKTGGFRKNG